MFTRRTEGASARRFGIAPSPLQQHRVRTPWPVIILALVAMSLLAQCGGATPTPAPSVSPAKELIVYDWPGYMPQSALDAFTAEYGTTVTLLTYDTQEAAVANLEAGMASDVVLVDGRYIPNLIARNLLAEIDYQNVPNLKNVAADFRDLAFDPGNRHSVLFEWGTTGILARQDRLAAPVARWADLWDARYAGKVGLWPYRATMMAIALKAGGSPLNPSDLGALAAAGESLLQLKQNAFMVDPTLSTAAKYVTDGEAVMVVGWSFDALEARKQNDDIRYVVPEDGVILWGDNLVIPANSPNKQTAELFINFLLRPEISARFVNETFVATTNEAARPFVKPELRNDPIIFPPNDVVKQGEWLMHSTPEAQKLEEEIWARFMAAPQRAKP